jgi:hypothetical protein
MMLQCKREVSCEHLFCVIHVDCVFTVTGLNVGDHLHDLGKEQSHESEVDDSSREQPVVVVYMIDPFDFGNESSPHRRLASFGLLQCFNEFVSSLPDTLQSNVHLQLLPLQLIYQHDLCPDMNYLRRLALSVYTQACRVLTSSQTTRLLTCNSAMAVPPPPDANLVSARQLY